jgi:hypothetical protein
MEGKLKLMAHENKQNFFCLRLETDVDQAFSERETEQKDLLSESIDLVLNAMSVGEEWYSFLSEDETVLIYYFKTESRKRVGQLRRICEKNLPISEFHFYGIKGFDKKSFYDQIRSLLDSSAWTAIRKPSQFSEYDGEDLDLFEDLINLFPWQKKVYEMLFEKDGQLKKPDRRKIISIVDFEGKKGKSSFLKYLCYLKPSSFAKLGYGSSSQLRSATVNGGGKEVYLIDLPRTKGANDKVEDLLSVIEEIKNGFITSPMYGRSGALMMKPPFVFVFSNQHLPYGMLSKDRWECYSIVGTKQPDLKSVRVTTSLGSVSQKSGK